MGFVNVLLVVDGEGVEETGVGCGAYKYHAEA